jgi:ABC-type multidrug transport system fused ATPase/permease subunit
MSHVGYDGVKVEHPSPHRRSVDPPCAEGVLPDAALAEEPSSRLVSDVNDQGMKALAAMPNSTASAEAGGIEATGLTKSYGSVQAVRGIDLRIEPGDTVILLGPNGAGMTRRPT